MAKVKLALSVEQLTNMVWPIMQTKYADDLKGFTNGEIVNIAWFINRNGVVEIEVSSK